MVVGTTFAQGDSATATTASALVSIPSPGRLIGLRYGVPAATNAGALTALTSGDVDIKAETTAGVQIGTDAAASGLVGSGFVFPVGTVAVDEARGATAATDGFSGGFPVRQGVFIQVGAGTAATEGVVVEVDLIFRLSSYVTFDLVAQSGADGTGAATYTYRHGKAGHLAAIALDFQNMPATTDLTIYADEATTGAALFTGTSSATDLAPSIIGRPAFDEAINAGAATDGTEGCNAFFGQLVFVLAEGDIFTSGNEKIVVECWIDD